MAGVPPAAGFFGKYFLFWQAYERGLTFLVITGLLTSLISMYYYLKLIKLIWFSVPAFSAPTVLFTTRSLESGNSSLWAVILLFLYLFIFFTSITLDVFDKLCVSLYFIS